AGTVKAYEYGLGLTSSAALGLATAVGGGARVLLRVQPSEPTARLRRPCGRPDPATAGSSGQGPRSAAPADHRAGPDHSGRAVAHRPDGPSAGGPRHRARSAAPGGRHAAPLRVPTGGPGPTYASRA
ncbi:TRIC cation channel family protein, partial [Streptomyces sp. NPDC053741]|uniref:TRIC cation channel family protein n=1 Tax=Streptomyces sp. NPDC053741 TaxID=3156684 RepID=UPI00341D4404